MNELFVSVKVDREERPDVDAVYMDAVVALTGQGGWPMTVFLTPDGRAVLRRHVLPARAAARAARVPAGARAIAEAYRDAARRRREAGRGARRRAASAARSCSRRASRSPTELLDEAVRRAARAVRPALGRLRPRAEVPARLDARVPAARAASLDLVRGTLDGMARGRHVRPRRRRLPPLLGRRAVARAALREDALRQRAARPGVPARLARDRRGALPRGRRADASSTCCASSGSTAAASPRRRTPTPTASRG